MASTSEKTVSFFVEEHITATFKTDNESSETLESEFTDYVESLSDTGRCSFWTALVCIH